VGFAIISWATGINSEVSLQNGENTIPGKRRINPIASNISNMIPLGKSPILKEPNRIKEATTCPK
jgi:hypothetical protein